MSVPLDNLYDWVESLVPCPVVLYVFQPHGSKKISDCDWHRVPDHSPRWEFPGVIMHDQEPLDWDFYNTPDQYKDWWKTNGVASNPFFNEANLDYYAKFNLKSIVFVRGTLYDQAILIHSEKNSADLIKYQQNGFLCVHYWAHAIIARDWYRFAQHDSRLYSDTKPQNKFLIYCRDWSHRREYRLKFLELLVQNDLESCSQTSVMHVNSEGVHFSQHTFKNHDFVLDSPALLDQFSNNEFSSAASADYDPLDFTNSEISVVLETVFDDSRIHLTEKTLKPIACGHPFILAAGPGALEYIRSYGFKTFAPWIDESYDQETNSLRRLEKIIESMKQIQNLQGRALEEFSHEVKQIAEFNKTHFFSDKFSDQVRSELANNLEQACSKVKHSQGKYYLELVRSSKNLMPWRREKTQFLRQLRQAGRGSQSNPQTDPLA